MIKADIYFDGEFYCGRCIDIDVFTQGKTLDELAINLKEAIQLHFVDDPESLSDYSPNPVAKGTLNDILGKVAIWNQVSKEKLIEMVK
jgi:predicted RNase H-like HicB family nuclease